MDLGLHVRVHVWDLNNKFTGNDNNFKIELEMKRITNNLWKHVVLMLPNGMLDKLHKLSSDNKDTYLLSASYTEKINLATPALWISNCTEASKKICSAKQNAQSKNKSLCFSAPLGVN